MNDTEVKLKFSNSITGEKKLEKYAESLSKINSLLNGLDKGTMKELENSSVNIKEMNKDFEKVKNSGDKLFSTKSIIPYIKSIKNLSKNIMRLTSISATYLENMNLLDVAYRNDRTSADKFVNTLSEMYGLDESWGYRTVGIFKQLANAMGLADEIGTKLSETMTQFAIDVSSLYNIDTNNAVSILQSALAGQTKPARRLGADITQTTLQTTLDQEGIDRNITGLSYVEKRLVIVASLLNQVKEANGDWGRTIESVANQTRIMGEQWNRLSRAIGNVFLPIIKQILPYINAVLMVLTEIFSMIASLVGFKEEDFDFFAGANESIEEFGSGLESAGKSAKKLKQGLRGFDKLNVISTPSSSGSGASAGGGLGVDPKIMDLFNKATDEYNQKLEKIQMKATRIRDSIMEWLGFTKEVDSETGKVSFKFEKITSGTVLGALAVGGSIYVGIKNILGFFNKLSGLGLFKGFSSLFKGIGSITGLSSLFGDIGAGIELIKEGYPVFEVLKEILPALGGAVSKISGIATAVFGVFELFEGINKLFDDSIPKYQAISKIIEGIALIVGGIALMLGGWTVALVAGVVYLGAVIVENWEKIKGWLSKIGNWIYKNVIKPVIGFLKEIVTSVYEVVILPIYNFAEPLVSAVSTIIGKIIEIILKIGEIFIELGKAFYNFVIKPIIETASEIANAIYNKAIKPVMEWLKNTGKWINENAIQPTLKFFKDVATWIYDHVIKPIYDKIVWIKNKAVEIFKSIGTTVVDFISGLFKSVVNGIFSKIEHNINGFIKLLNGAINVINDIPGVSIKKVSELKLPRLKTGIDFVPNDFYPAFLDYGERVLTKEENQDYNAIMNNSNKSAKLTSFNPTFIIQVGDKEIAKQVLNNLEDMAKNDGTPIVIGG